MSACTFTTRVVLGLAIAIGASAETGVREAYATVPGARIFYRDTGGSGVPAILLHAATGSSRVWEYQIAAFTAAGYRVIAFDRRGWAEPRSMPENRKAPRPTTYSLCWTNSASIGCT